MTGWCIWSSMKISEVESLTPGIERLANGKVRCACGRLLKESSAGYGAGTSLPRHKEPTEEAS